MGDSLRVCHINCQKMCCGLSRALGCVRNGITGVCTDHLYKLQTSVQVRHSDSIEAFKSKLKIKFFALTFN